MNAAASNLTKAHTPTLSVLDLVPVRTGQSSTDAISASLAMVRQAEELGYHRYWFAEHHNMPAVASTSPAVLIAAALARTARMRLGSGGVMLPNHAPLIVAEQFAALEAMAPGRIDLGIGRAPGSDPVVTHLLRSSGTTSDVDEFPSHIQNIRAYLNSEGAELRFTSGGKYQVHATPSATGSPDVWLLGSSDYSAQLAAASGLPYVFANHFAGPGLARALRLYRENYQASPEFPEPVTFCTITTVAADTAEEAAARALPQLRAMVRIRRNRPLRVLETVEEAQQAIEQNADPVDHQILDALRAQWLIGDGATVAAQIADFARKHAVDEVMISPVAGSFAAEATDQSPGRVRTLELIAQHLAV